MKEKCCGNCKHFDNEGVDGCGFCEVIDDIVLCNDSCEEHSHYHNGWTEITQDNEDEVYNLPPERIVIANVVNGLTFYTTLLDTSITISTMAKCGGYYYYELPELRLE